MLVASTCLVVFVLAWILSPGHSQRPLDRDEVLRIRRFSDKLHREESLPYE
jgi:hypothetical protein